MRILSDPFVLTLKALALLTSKIKAASEVLIVASLELPAPKSKFAAGVSVPIPTLPADEMRSLSLPSVSNLIVPVCTILSAIDTSPPTLKVLLNDPVVPLVGPLKLAALKAPVDELNVRLALVAGVMLPVACVANKGKQVESLALFTAVTNEVVPVTSPVKFPVNVVALIIPTVSILL